VELLITCPVLLFTAWVFQFGFGKMRLRCLKRNFVIVYSMYLINHSDNVIFSGIRIAIV